MQYSDHQSTQSGSLIGCNDDLLTEIFLRLPVTSIIRFKSVSKHWRWLLSHRHFTLRYDHPSKSPGFFAGKTYFPFDVRNRSTPPFRNIDIYFNHRDISIVQSCNGLLLCRDVAWDTPGIRYYVFNPTTKQLAIIPWIHGGRKVQKTILFMCLAFHQTDCVHYKVVCIRRLVPDAELFQIQTYSSDSQRWDISIESFSANHPSFKNGVYWNGAIHWASSYRSHLYFDMNTEQLLTLPLPVAGMTRFESYGMYFGESRDHLHSVVFINGLKLNVYEMLMDHSGWFVKYEIELNRLAGAFPQIIHPNGYDFNVIDLVRGEKEEDIFMVLEILNKLITYNFHDKRFKHIYNFPYSSVHRYTELLAIF